MYFTLFSFLLGTSFLTTYVPNFYLKVILIVFSSFAMSLSIKEEFILSEDEDNVPINFCYFLLFGIVGSYFFHSFIFESDIWCLTIAICCLFPVAIMPLLEDSLPKGLLFLLCAFSPFVFVAYQLYFLTLQREFVPLAVLISLLYIFQSSFKYKFSSDCTDFNNANVQGVKWGFKNTFFAYLGIIKLPGTLASRFAFVANIAIVLLLAFCGYYSFFWKKGFPM